MKYFAELEEDAELIQQLQDEFKELKSRLPGDLFADHADLDLDNPAVFKEFLTEAKHLAESKLAGQEVSAGEIKYLNLPAFGIFTDRTIRFAPNHGLHIIYGRNEAGKSTLLSAISDALFGILGTHLMLFCINRALCGS